MATFRFRNRIAEFFRRVNPEANCIQRVGESGLLCRTVGRAAGEFLPAQRASGWYSP
jgi:hypothetical protein